MKTYVYFRNDDVNSLDRELIEITDFFLSQDIPIIHAVEPANVNMDTIDWLNDVKDKKPELIEIMQHGYDHKKRSIGEFGGNRAYNDQLKRAKFLDSQTAPQDEPSFSPFVDARG